MSQDPTDPPLANRPRSIEQLLAESRRLRKEADRLEAQAAQLREAVRKDNGRSLKR